MGWFILPSHNCVQNPSGGRIIIDPQSAIGVKGSACPSDLSSHAPDLFWVVSVVI